MTIATRLAALIFVAVLAACGSKGSPAAPSVPGNQTQFSVRIDGTVWTPARAYVSSFAGNTLITASDVDLSRMLAISFSGPARIGVHRIEYVEDLPVTMHYFEGAAAGPAWTSFSRRLSPQTSIRARSDPSGVSRRVFWLGVRVKGFRCVSSV